MRRSRNILLVFIWVMLLQWGPVTNPPLTLSEPAYAAPGGQPGPPPHAPAHGYRRQHTYLYYPSDHVYYDVERKLYFYLEGNGWKVGVSLPASTHLETGNAVRFELDTDKPYTVPPPGYAPGGASGKQKGGRKQSGQQ